MAVRRRNNTYENHDGSVKLKRKEDEPTFAERAAEFPIEVKRRGRRLTLTEEMIGCYGRALNQGTQEMAAAITGLSVRTINDWIEKAREPDCEDEMLLLLRDTHDAVMAGGNRQVALGLVFEHAVDDPKTALELARAIVPGFDKTKSVKKDVNITLNKAPDMSAFENMSPEEILLADAMERARLKRLGGG